MVISNLRWQEVVDEQLIKDIQQLQRIALGEGPVACQVCDRKLREGDELTAYAFRAAGNPSFEIGYVMCGADEHAHPTEFIRGVHELIVTGRIGLCTDVATQSSWLVLIAPEPIVASRPTSSDAHTVGEVTTRDPDPLHQDTPEDGPTLSIEKADQRWSEQVEWTSEHTADYSQLDVTYQADHNDEDYQYATSQRGDE